MSFDLSSCGKMTNHQIRTKLKKLHDRLVAIKQSEDSTRLEIRHLQERCPHTIKEKWTNDDGDGRFTVERCTTCGLQRDGGLR